MELLYLWIESYKNINRQGFNFNSRYFFKFNIDNNELKIEEKPNYIEDFFPKKITNVTAIIGENGAGKSSLLEFIREFDSGKINFPKENKIIVAFYYDGSNERVSLRKGIYINSTAELSITGIKELSVEHKNFESSLSYLDLLGIWTNTVIIYYSNIFDGEVKSFEENGPHLRNNTVNISTNILMGNKNTSSSFRLEEIERQLHFLSSYPKLELDFKLPRKLSVSLIDYEINDKDTERITNKSLKIVIDNIENWLKSESFQNNSKFFTNSLKKYIFSYFIHQELLSRSTQIEAYDSFLEKAVTINDFNNYFETFFEALKNWRIDSSYKYPDQITWIDNIFLLLKLIDDNISNQARYHLSIDIFDDSLFFHEFIKQYKVVNSFSSSVFFRFNWYFEKGDPTGGGLSTGEKAILNLYSRVFYALNELDSDVYNRNEINNIILIIDEGDLGLHPQWQKRYIHDLINYLCNAYSTKRFQIILTSHSPFIISDLPASNIIFLKKDTEGKCQVVENPLADKKPTFAANIHTLLADSFFIEGGLIGDWAKIKINEVIEDLIANKPISDARKKQIKNIIHSIGEPIIKRKLLQLFNDNFKLNVDDEIELLKERLSKLEASKEQNDSDKKRKS